jgi:hypothetical protein
LRYDHGCGAPRESASGPAGRRWALGPPTDSSPPHPPSRWYAARLGLCWKRRPALAPPRADDRVLARGGPSDLLPLTPPDLPEESTQMGGMVAHAKRSLDHGGDPLGRSYVAWEPVGPSTRFQQAYPTRLFARHSAGMPDQSAAGGPALGPILRAPA